VTKQIFEMENEMSFKESISYLLEENNHPLLSLPDSNNGGRTQCRSDRYDEDNFRFEQITTGFDIQYTYLW
jgi:hypothetical protein